MNGFDVIFACFFALAVYEILSPEGKLMILGTSIIYTLVRVLGWL